MWRTSCGDRTLKGAEAHLFAEALLNLLDEENDLQFEGCSLGIECFDGLTYGQTIPEKTQLTLDQGVTKLAPHSLTVVNIPVNQPNY